MVKVVLINSSPRKFGSTKKLLLAAEKGVRDAGCGFSMVDLYDYELKPCQGCVSDDIMLCRYPCPIEDDFRKIGDMILEAEGIILGTPIYWYGPSGLLKNLIDRLTSMENMIYHVGYSLLDGKAFGVVAAGNDTGAIMSISYLMGVFNSMGCLIPPWALAYHHSTQDVLDNNSAILDAYNVGLNVCRASKRDHPGDEGKWYNSDVDVELIKRYIRETVEGKDKIESEERKNRFSR